MKSPQLPDAEPDEIIIDRCAQLILQQPRRLTGGRFPIAMFPNQSRRLIQAMSLVSLHVINQGLIIQFLDDEIIRYGKR